MTRNRLVAMAGAVLIALTAAQLPATAHANVSGSADEVGVMTGWLGECWAYEFDGHGGGRCDGNGPDFTFRGAVRCTNGGIYYGPVRWAGDTRYSWAYCPFGIAWQGGVLAFNHGNLVREKWTAA